VRSDLYSLGIVLYEMLTGDAPFVADSPWAVMRDQIETVPASVKIDRPDVPDWLAAIVTRALAKDPELRFQTPGDMLAVLRYGTMPPANLSALAHTPTPRPAPRRRPASRQSVQIVALACIAALLLITLAVLVVMVLSGEEARASREDLEAGLNPVTTAPQIEDSASLAAAEPVSSGPSVTPTPLPPVAADVVTPTLTSADTSRTPTPSPTVTATASRTSTATLGGVTVTASLTPSRTATATRTRTPSPTLPPGLIADFETFGTWKRGDEDNGTFAQSNVQVHQGAYAGRLDYHFDTQANDYVVFMQTRAISGQPKGITGWVYGDGSGYLLNAWIKDKGGQVWQVPLGAVRHTGWQEMAGAIDVNQPWPWTHISGPDNQVVDYPVSFVALVLDDVPDTSTRSGTIYVDDLRAGDDAPAHPPSSTPRPAATTPVAPGPTIPPPSVTPPPGSAAPVIDFWADETTISQGASTTLRWHVENVREIYLDGASVTGPDGSKVVQPAQTTTFELRVVHAGGEERRQLTITVTAGQGGTLSVTSEGAVDGSASGSALVKPSIIVGDELLDTAFGPYEDPQQGTLSFDFSGVPDGAIVESVELAFFQVSVEGEPYNNLGAFFLRHVEYHNGPSYGSPDLGSLSLPFVERPGEWYVVRHTDLIGWVQKLLNAGEKRVQFRLSFGIDKFVNGRTDAIWIESGENSKGTGNLPRLTITYR
ncbi:MAG TPA: flagellar filament outer layer protein FlaA, partial [Anaerolineae bacterium]|nr:flagellar filament outer layer protein FlaA [Anaerolineae bacterium]